jgi:hypothetical protein
VEQKKMMMRLARLRRWAVVLGVAAAGIAGRVEAALPERLAQLVEAQILGVHAYQVHLFRESGKGDPACYAAGALTDADLETLEGHQTALLAGDVAGVRAWAEGRESSFDPAKDLAPLLGSGLALADDLPVNVFTRDLHRRAPDRPRTDVRAIANLYQTVLEVERDGDRLQELYRFYIGLGLPVYVGQLGLPGTDADLLAVGRELEGQSCPSPVGITAAEWQIAGRKIWNWGEKNLHVRDARVLADELLAELDLAPLLPRLRALPPRRIAVIGHSFTMDLHWSSPSAFAPIVAAMFARENPGVEFKMFQAGGLTASRAYRDFYRDALAWRPGVVLFVVANRTDEDLEAFQQMGLGFAREGATVYTFDTTREPEAGRPGDPAKDAAAARQAGMKVIEVGPLLARSPDRDRFVCLDGIHMTEPYHRLMAREWVKLLIGARTPALGS